MKVHGGVAIFIRENINVERIQLNTAIQAVAVKVNYPYVETIYNIYLLDINWSLNELQHLLEQLPEPLILLGDFNSHNTLWGSEFTDRGKRDIEKITKQFNINLLNTGEGTYMNSRSHTLSHIDISMCSPTFHPKIQ